jgi:hypothetical protein
MMGGSRFVYVISMKAPTPVIRRRALQLLLGAILLTAFTGCYIEERRGPAPRRYYDHGRYDRGYDSRYNRGPVYGHPGYRSGYSSSAYRGRGTTIYASPGGVTVRRSAPVTRGYAPVRRGYYY